jgi:regulator of sigma E protease
MEMLFGLLHTILSFVLIISFIVFIHEFGHYFVARRFGVKVETFSIGMGKEIWGFNDKNGTRWKFSYIPLGGYVKFFGDRNIASQEDKNIYNKMDDAQKNQSFIGKKLWQKFAIVAAGPLANYILAIILFAGLFYYNGVFSSSNIISEVIKDSPAYNIGIKAGDKIIAVDGNKVDSFQEVQTIVFASSGSEMEFSVIRNDDNLNFTVIPKLNIVKDEDGKESKFYTIGIATSNVEKKQLGLLESLSYATVKSYQFSVLTLQAIGQMITGERDSKQISGIIGIAKYSGQSTTSAISTIWFIAILSLNLGLMNLLPIPMLDGGHLFFYLVEGITRRPINEKVQNFSFRLGIFLLSFLMLYATVNDIINF